MRNLERNKQKVFYKILIEITPVIDEHGNEIGEYTRHYSDFKEYSICVSSGKGENTVELFGDNVIYDKVMTTADTKCSINENSILWIDRRDKTQPYDYIVTRVSRSINGISYAVRSVNVS